MRDHMILCRRQNKKVEYLRNMWQPWRKAFQEELIQST
jgi:hypothetical protein